MIVWRVTVRTFCGVVHDVENEEEVYIENGNETLMPKIEAVLTAGKQSQKTEEKLYVNKTPITRRLLLLERVCKMNTQFCWDYFRGNSPSARRLLELLMQGCLTGVGGVQESCYQVLVSLLLPDTTSDVRTQCVVHRRWRTSCSCDFSTAAACTC